LVKANARRPALLGVDHRQRQRGIALLLSDRWQDQNPPIPDFKDGVRRITIVVSDLDAMKTLGLDLIHFIGNRVIAVSGQAIDANSHQKVRSSKSRSTEPPSGSAVELM
jgi:hypothetical protein